MFDVIWWNAQSVALAKHPAPISLAASVFSMGEAMLMTTGAALIKDPNDWIVPGLTEVAAILYAVSLTSKLCLNLVRTPHHSSLMTPSST